MNLSNCYHLRSDALLAMLIQLGFPAEQVDIDFNGDFKKRYTSGLEAIRIEDKSVHMALNECSIYHQLPEGLFHQSRGNQANQHAKNYIDEHQRYKQEAKLAIKFFNPLDQVLLLARADARLKKESVLQDLMKEDTAFLARFWGLDQYSNNRYLSSLLPLLYHKETYQARPHKLAEIIGSILNCKVLYRLSRVSVAEVIATDASWLLGINTCLATNDNESMRQWTFVLKDIGVDLIEEFFTNKDVAQLLDLLVQFFVPIDIQVDYEFDIPELQELDHAVLGISTL